MYRLVVVASMIVLVHPSVAVVADRMTFFRMTPLSSRKETKKAKECHS